MGRDFYAILGIPRDADEQQIKKGYRKMAVRWHPDKHSGAEQADAETKFKETAEAYEVLSNPDTRAAYDRYGEDGLRAGASSGGGGSGGGHASFMRGGPGVKVVFSRSDSDAVFRQFFSTGDPFAGFGFGDDDFVRRFQHMSSMGTPTRGGRGFAGRDGAPNFVLPGRDGAPRAGWFGRRRSRDKPREDEAIQWLPSQTTVKLTGLTSDALNGVVGVVEGFDGDRCRYNVRLPDPDHGEGAGGSIVALKPVNVRQVINGATAIGTSQEALNGRFASQTVYDTSTARYVMVGLSAQGRPLALKAENVKLPVGTRVNVENVKSRPELNSQAGLIVDVDDERYTVQLIDGEQVRLRFGAVIALHGHQRAQEFEDPRHEKRSAGQASSPFGSAPPDDEYSA